MLYAGIRNTRLYCTVLRTKICHYGIVYQDIPVVWGRIASYITEVSRMYGTDDGTKYSSVHNALFFSPKNQTV